MDTPHQLSLSTDKGGPFAEIIGSIDDEVVAVERDAARSFDVTEGRRLHRGIGGTLYTFRAELSIPLAPETPVRVITDGQRLRGVLVAVDDFDLLVHLPEDAGESLSPATIVSQPAFILESLRERLLAVAGEGRTGLPTDGVAGVLTGAEPVQAADGEEVAGEAAAALAQLDDPSLVPNPAQLRAMSRAAGSNLHFVWGPPGTGKTANLAQIARMLVDSGERVLVLAHANVAVDVAMLRIADTFRDTGALGSGRVVRVGTPQHPDALDREEILLDGVLARRAPQLALEKVTLEDRRRALATALRSSGDDVERDELATELRRVRERLTALRQELKAMAESIVQNASVVGSTLSRFVISDLLWELRPDAILLDEASMVSFPWVLASATRATKRLVVLGDFRQLPPVYVAKTDLAARWLRRDVFEVAGVRERIDAGQEDERVTLLDTQYRMAAPIGNAVSELAYGNRLRMDASAADRAAVLARSDPWPGESLILVDTSELAPICGREAGRLSFSRINPLHLALGLSLTGLIQQDAALISPYRAQARLLAAGLRDLHSTTAIAATIHRFQGSERDVVIFDLVDAPPENTPSRLTGTDLDLALRLTNVGLSRAKGKAVLLAHGDLVEERFAPASPVRRALELCRRLGHVVRPTATDMALAFEPGPIEWFDSWDRLCDRLLTDLRAATTSASVNAPGGFELPDDAIEMLAELGRRARSSVAAPAQVLTRLEDNPVELRLLLRPGFMAIIDQTVAYLAGSDPGCGVRLSAASLASLLENTFLGSHEKVATALPGASSGTRELPRAG